MAIAERSHIKLTRTKGSTFDYIHKELDETHVKQMRLLAKGGKRTKTRRSNESKRRRKEGVQNKAGKTHCKLSTGTG